APLKRRWMRVLESTVTVMVPRYLVCRVSVDGSVVLKPDCSTPWMAAALPGIGDQTRRRKTLLKEELLRLNTPMMVTTKPALRLSCTVPRLPSDRVTDMAGVTATEMVWPGRIRFCFGWRGSLRTLTLICVMPLLKPVMVPTLRVKARWMEKSLTALALS